MTSRNILWSHMGWEEVSFHWFFQSTGDTYVISLIIVLLSTLYTINFELGHWKLKSFAPRQIPHGVAIIDISSSSSSCLVCVCVVILCVFVVLCVHCCFFLLWMPECWLEVSIRKVLLPAISKEVFLGFPVPKSKCWDGSQDSKLPLHASHVALPT